MKETLTGEVDELRARLGVGPGASARELKEAYRDLAKVWHPDRFAHDPRLQQKAQEKLKEINEAYELLSSGRPGRRRPQGPPARTEARPPRGAKRPGVRRQFSVAALATGAALLVAYSALPGRDGTTTESPPPPAEASRTHTEADQPGSANDKRKPWPATPAGRSQTRRPAPSEGGEPQSVAEPAPALPLPTVAVTIDSVNGLVATRHCPNKVTMTFRRGLEPTRQCPVAHKTDVRPVPE